MSQLTAHIHNRLREGEREWLREATARREPSLKDQPACFDGGVCLLIASTIFFFLFKFQICFVLFESQPLKHISQEKKANFFFTIAAKKIK